MTLQVSDAIANLGATTYTLIHRANNGFDSNGRAIAPTESTSSTTGMMQPLGGREIDRLAEGLHAKELRAYWSTDRLVVADSDAQTDGDHINDGTGTLWEVVRVEDWTAVPLGGYFRYVVSRVDP